MTPLDDTIERLLAGFDAGVASFTQRLEGLARSLSRTSSGLLTTPPTPQTAADILRKAGFGMLQSQIESTLRDAQEAFSGEQIDDIGLTLRPTERVLNTARSFSSVQLRKIGGISVTSLSGLLQQATYTSMSVDSFAKQAAHIADTTISRARTIADTAIAGMQRAAAVQAAAELPGETVFLYTGPSDRVTRDFCEERVGKVYTTEEIAAMDNEQGLPVDLFGGGYNCRHSWQPLTRESAEEMGLL